MHVVYLGGLSMISANFITISSRSSVRIDSRACRRIAHQAQSHGLGVVLQRTFSFPLYLYAAPSSRRGHDDDDDDKLLQI